MISGLKDMAEGAARHHETRRRAPGAAWSSPLGAILLVGALTAAAAGALFWTFSDRGPTAHKPVNVPATPQIEAAINASQGRLSENSQDIAAMVQLGILHFEKGEDFYIDAANELEEARDLGAQDTRIFYCLGVIYQKFGLYNFAMEEYRRFLRNHPEDRETRMLLAFLLYQQGRYSDAVSEYERLKFHFPKDALIEENMALSLQAAKLHDRAAESFKTLMTFGPAAALRARLHLGEMDYERGRYAPALENFKLVAVGLQDGTLKPDDVSAEKIYALLAATYRGLNLPEESRSAWRKVLEVVPGDPKANAALKELNRRFPVKKSSSGGKAPPKKP